MAFTFTIDGQTVFGNKRVKWGTYQSDNGWTGGDIVTEMNELQFGVLQPIAAAVGTTHVLSTASVPYSPTVTIITGANEQGLWFAYGL